MLRDRLLKRSIPLCLVWVLAAQLLPAQDDRQPSNPPESRGRVGRDQLTRPDLRIGTLPREADDPQMDLVLADWAAQSRQIKRLQGQHLRIIRDFVGGEEIPAQGKFYVEMPDKGRIDVQKYTGGKAKAGDKHICPSPSGTPTQLTTKLDLKPECWICDGTEIKMIDDHRKTYDVVKIPPQQQGENIMDGPLPFLFGMPPEKAKQRYRFQLFSKDAKSIKIWVHPKRKLDAAEWSRAYVVLNAQTYLPSQVHLIDPAGTKETIYLFGDIKMNSGILDRMFEGDPFHPIVLKFYQREVHNAPTQGIAAGNGAPSMAMPFLLGADADYAKKFKTAANSRGVKVLIVKGRHATKASDEFHIAAQKPAPNTPLNNGDEIVLTYYDTFEPPIRRDAAKPSDEDPR